MRVGILGSGLMGGKLGTLFARAGHEVVFSYSRTPTRFSFEPTGSSGAVSVILLSPWSRERSPAPAGRARGFFASGSGRWALAEAREQAMARADHSRTG